LKRGTGTQSKQPGLCFFNTSQGSNLVTLEKMLTQTNRMTVNNNDDGIYVFDNSNTFLYNKILS
jgi:hypothetical protein